MTRDITDFRISEFLIAIHRRALTTRTQVEARRQVSAASSNSPWNTFQKFLLCGKRQPGGALLHEQAIYACYIPASFADLP